MKKFIDNIKYKINAKGHHKLEASHFFMHVPKTAGTSFRYALYNYFDYRIVFPNALELKHDFNGKYPSIKLIKEKKIIGSQKKKKLFCGHYAYNFVELLKGEVKTLVFLREPVARIQSQIWHLKTKNPIFHDMEIQEIMDRKLKQIANLQAKMFGLIPGTVNLEKICSAIDLFDFIGITENYESSVKLCNQTFDWNLQSSDKMNLGSKDYKSLFNQSQIEQIIAVSNLDRRLYKEAKNIFEQRIKSLNMA